MTAAIVPMFFILSGFLVTGSAVRLPLGKFALSRSLRIVPALFVDTVFTVFVLDALFTTLPLADYAAHPTTRAYLLNIIGEIHFYLPGVFADNPLPDVVNGALWTIPPELGCYLTIGLLIAFGWVRNWKIVAGMAVGLMVVIIAGTVLQDRLPPLLAKIITYPGAALVPGFLIGSLLFLKRHLVPYSLPLFLACLAIIVGSGYVLSAESYAGLPIWIFSMIPVYGYVTLFIGATRIPPLPFFRRGDYSYGIYLYGFPIQQAIVASTGITNPFLLFVSALPVILALAVFSWHVVEKPTLKLRKAFSMSARHESKP